MTSTLILDIGSGTQDVLYHLPDREIENCPKFVLPSPARSISRSIQNLAGNDIHLTGRIMGGGFTKTIKQHIALGGKVSAEPHAALSISDDPDRVQAIGIELNDHIPDGYEPVLLADFNPDFWRNLLCAAGLDYPDRIISAAQDHGFHPKESNRRGRFRLWERFLLEAGGKPESLLYSKAPDELTRLADLLESTREGGNGNMVADTGSAAVLGALFVDEIEHESHDRGITVVNIGNSHTVAFLVHKGRILGVYEHHTGLLNPNQLWDDLSLFRKGKLTMDAVFESGGHGCLTMDIPDTAAGFVPTYVLGPKRVMFIGRDVTFPAPGGDMMLAGCFGLLKGLELLGI